jgi:hypothetical protein
MCSIDLQRPPEYLFPLKAWSEYLDFETDLATRYCQEVNLQCCQGDSHFLELDCTAINLTRRRLVVCLACQC